MLLHCAALRLPVLLLRQCCCFCLFCHLWLRESVSWLVLSRIMIAIMQASRTRAAPATSIGSVPCYCCCCCCWCRRDALHIQVQQAASCTAARQELVRAGRGKANAGCGTHLSASTCIEAAALSVLSPRNRRHITNFMAIMVATAYVLDTSTVNIGF